MRKQLFIKGQEMDLMGNTYAMEWVSPLFQNLGDIKENRSTTIKLSKTNHNLAVLGNFNVINVNSSAPYSFIEAEYRINGVPIISNAKMYVLGIGNNYIDVCLLWNFNKLVAESLKRKLSTLGNMSTIKFDGGITPGVLTDAMVGLPVVQPNPLDYKAHNLFIRESDLVDYIFMHEFGGLFTHKPEPDNGNMIELPTRKTIGSKTVITGYLNRKSNKLYSHNIRAISSTFIGNKRFEVINNIDRLLFPLKSGRYTFNVELSNDLDVGNIDSVNLTKWFDPEKGDEEYYRYVNFGKSLTFNELLHYEHTTGNYGKYEVEIWFDYKYTPLSDSCTITITQDDETLQSGDDYLISPNLPDLTISEYLKDYFVRENKFLYFDSAQNSLGVATIGNFKDVFESDIIDWSEKLLSQETMSFKPDNMAQKNIYKYKDNDEVTYKSDGSINIFNESMDKENVTYESRFAPAPEDTDGTVVIPHFDEKGEYYDSKLNYIVNLRNKSLSGIPDGRKSASFTQGDSPLPFDTILSTHYTDYSQIFINYKEVTVKVLLNTADILNLDLKKRYYFSQFSSNFLIKKCSIVDEIATLTLIKL